MSDTDNYEGVVELNVYSHENIQPDKELAKAEHDLAIKLLGYMGCKVIQRESAPGCQDGVYTANQAFCRRDVAVLGRLPNARQDEEKHAELILRSLGKRIFRMPKWVERYSGQGDTLPCGNVLFVGSGYRTSPEAADYLEYLWPDYNVVRVKTVPKLDKNGEPAINEVSGWEDSEFYDIDLAMGILKPPTEEAPGLIAVCKKAFTKESWENIKQACAKNNIEIIKVSYKEAVKAFACNFISNGIDTVLMSTGAPKFEKKLREKGLEPVTQSLEELNKAGGGDRCIGLTLDND